MSGSSGGFNAEDIRLCYRYLKEAESLPRDRQEPIPRGVPGG